MGRAGLLAPQAPDACQAATQTHPVTSAAAQHQRSAAQAAQPAQPSQHAPGVPTTMSTPSCSARAAGPGLVPPTSSSLRSTGSTRYRRNAVKLVCVCSARSLQGVEGRGGCEAGGACSCAHGPAQRGHHQARPLVPQPHLAGSRMMASGLRSTPLLVGASCHEAVATRGAAARPTKPGGGVCLKGAAPKLTVSSAFFRQMAG